MRVTKLSAFEGLLSAIYALCHVVWTKVQRRGGRGRRYGEAGSSEDHAGSLLAVAAAFSAAYSANASGVGRGRCRATETPASAGRNDGSAAATMKVAHVQAVRGQFFDGHASHRIASNDEP